MNSLTTAKKHKIRAVSPKPKNVWHTLRRLENHLNKAHIQSGVFMNELGRLRDEISFEIRKEIASKLATSVHGDILHALCERIAQLESGDGRGDVLGNAILLGLHESLLQELNISAFHKDAEKLNIRATSVQEYDFESYPSALDTVGTGRLSIQVVNCGWKVDGKVVVKPKVMELLNADATICQ